ncbi:MAG: AAA family ATPase [Aquificae bacterium]|nr:AAA family ATPase [Aquificota bacterium]
MNYFTDFYGFQRDPFENSHDIDSYYLSSVHKPVLSRLYKSVYEDGIDVILGEDGTGKTITAKKFITELKQTKAIYISCLENSFDSFIKTIGEKILERELDETNREILTEIENYTRDHRVVIVIDNLQEASLNLIENIRLISEIKNIKLILIGNGYFEKILRLSFMKQLSTRIRNFLFLKNLNKKDTKKYIDAKLYYAQGNVTIARASYKLIYEITKGNPYDINLLMEEALYLASLKKKRKIRPAVIKKAAKHLGFKTKKKIGILGTLIFILILLIFGLFLYYSGIIGFNTQEQPKQKVEKVQKDTQELAVKKEETTPPALTQNTNSLQNITTQEPKKEEIKEATEPTETKETQPVEATINVSLLNIREKPNTNSRILAVVPKGYKVKIIEEREDGWVKIIYYSKSQGREIIGWVNKKYLSIGNNNG